MASEQSLEADPVTLNVRLGDDVQLYCPLFQRRYVWGRTQIDRLWDDIDTIRDETYPRRFLGALVFNEDLASTATQAGRYWIIDGQQRLTTMVLTLVALAAHAQHFGEEGKEIAQDLFGQYLVSRKKNSKNQPKLCPTLTDTRQFNDIMRSAFGYEFDLEVDMSREAGDPDGDMTKAYNIILSHIVKRTSKLSDDEELGDEEVISNIEKLRDVLLEALEFVEIRLGSSHDPNEVFDRLNNEGVKLGIIDLVRNDVLKRLDKDGKQALKVYQNEWKPFEEAFSDNGAKTGYFFPFALTIDPTVTKASTFNALSSRWSDLVKDKELDARGELLEIMSDLRSHQASFNAIHSGRLDQVEPELTEHVRRLVDLNRPGSTYPYVMQLLTSASSGDCNVANATECLEIIESFLVRRGLLGIEPTGLHAIFKKLWKDANSDPSLVRQRIVSSTVQFPEDAAVSQAIRTGNLYNRKIRNYVILEYERAVSTGDVLDSFPPMTVDHLMPQNYSDDWKKAISAEDHKRLVNTWGNLVPLSLHANSTKGCRSWNEARSLLQSESVFSTTKQVYMNSALWNAETIEQRSAEIEAWALQRWPFFENLL
ncbi:DUF262 domain-containing HNH endonuclease family protein [Arthrobacter sp. Cr_A7]|uniref:DUF262 domain-containing protein n=1 Tax=Arthrobacter sp. Cr_A7 TaxID=3031017 RepID=UPI0023DCA4B7|nr:DUF262 domain-containing HNH endonuclease family protein [Arthrobacter sp. Cr_A7]MDF2051170.1 DUF262 domain-containing HNH endonuclease family protein [Arthrobacter sp. Cr_A7]